MLSDGLSSRGRSFSNFNQRSRQAINSQTLLCFPVTPAMVLSENPNTTQCLFLISKIRESPRASVYFFSCPLVVLWSNFASIITGRIRDYRHKESIFQGRYDPFPHKLRNWKEYLTSVFSASSMQSGTLQFWPISLDPCLHLDRRPAYL